MSEVLERLVRRLVRHWASSCDGAGADAGMRWGLRRGRAPHGQTYSTGMRPAWASEWAHRPGGRPIREANGVELPVMADLVDRGVVAASERLLTQAGQRYARCPEVGHRAYRWVGGRSAHGVEGVDDALTEVAVVRSTGPTQAGPAVVGARRPCRRPAAGSSRPSGPASTSGWTDFIRASTPATCGEAIDVPLLVP